MSKIIKNKSTDQQKVYAGMTILAESSYTILNEELESFQKDLNLLNDLLNDSINIIMIDSSNQDQEITQNDAIEFLLSSKVIVSDMPSIYPFAKKQLPDGKKLFRRKHGVRQPVNVGQSSSFDMIVPYNNCKIDKIEIVNGSDRVDEVEFSVYDTPEGLIQLSMGVSPENIIPSKKLNQFGFTVNVAKDYYEDKSNYDADLIKDMKISITVKNNSESVRTYGVNFVLHEIVG